MDFGPGRVTLQSAGGCASSHGVLLAAAVLPCMVLVGVGAGWGDEALEHPIRTLNAASNAQIWRSLATL